MMKISAMFIIASICSAFIFSACKKAPVKELTITEPSIIPPPSKPADTVAKPQPVGYDRIIDFGTGSGSVTIDGNKIEPRCNDLYRIKGGSYTGISIKNIISKDGCPITIKNDGLVKISGNFNSMDISNLQNVIISGDGTSGISKGFEFSNNSYRAIQIFGTFDKSTLQNMSFKNIADQDISYNNTTVYNGSESSYSKDLHFLNMSCDNTGSFLSLGGYVDNGVVYGLTKNIEIANIDFQNAASVGIVVYMGNVEDYNIHHNRINNINTTNNEHNGIFFLSGNGRFYNNFVSNHQGNALRAWGHTVGTTPKNILIYNNIIINSRKYSGFEVQAHANRIMPGITTFTNAVVFNNTCGNLNISNEWEAGVVDVYSLRGGKCDVYNNLGYKFYPGNHISLQWAELIPNIFSNLYYENYNKAGINDEQNFKISSNSPAKNTGKPTPFAITDYYGNVRNSTTPSIGAVE